MIIAKQPILYRGKQYGEGEQIPGAPADMIALWKKNKAIETVEEVKEKQTEKKPSKKAKQKTAPGAPGKPVNGNGEEGAMPGRPEKDPK